MGQLKVGRVTAFQKPFKECFLSDAVKERREMEGLIGTFQSTACLTFMVASPLRPSPLFQSSALHKSILTPTPTTPDTTPTVTTFQSGREGEDDDDDNDGDDDDDERGGREGH